MAWSPTDGEYFWDSSVRAILDSCNNTAVISGMSVTLTGAGVQSVDVASGVYLVAGTRVTYAGGTIAAPAADVTNPRKDILVADNAGALTFTQGTAASALPVGEIGVRTYQPVPPNIPASRLLLAEVYRAANDNTIVNADITEKFIITPGRMIGRELLTAQGQVIYASAAQTPAALATGTSGQYLQTQGAGANPQWANGTITIASQAQGDIVYFDGSAWTRLAAGTNTYFLKTQGAGANPAWVQGAYPTVSAGDLLQSVADTERSQSGAVYTKKKEIQIFASGVLRIKFDLNNDNTTAYGKIYRNGVAVGTEQSNGTTVYITFSEDISGWTAGDLCQVYTKVAGAGNALVKNFRIYHDSPRGATVITD